MLPNRVVVKGPTEAVRHPRNQPTDSGRYSANRNSAPVGAVSNYTVGLFCSVRFWASCIGRRYSIGTNGTNGSVGSINGETAAIWLGLVEK